MLFCLFSQSYRAQHNFPVEIVYLQHRDRDNTNSLFTNPFAAIFSVIYSCLLNIKKPTLGWNGSLYAQHEIGASQIEMYERYCFSNTHRRICVWPPVYPRSKPFFPPRLFVWKQRQELQLSFQWALSKWNPIDTEKLRLALNFLRLFCLWSFHLLYFGCGYNNSATLYFGNSCCCFRTQHIQRSVGCCTCKKYKDQLLFWSHAHLAQNMVPFIFAVPSLPQRPPVSSCFLWRHEPRSRSTLLEQVPSSPNGNQPTCGAVTGGLPLSRQFIAFVVLLCTESSDSNKQRQPMQSGSSSPAELGRFLCSRK